MRLALALLLLPMMAVAAPPNPLVRQRADPWVLRHSDGYYYFTATVPEYDRIELRRARTLEELAVAAPTVVWRRHAAGPMGAHIWAPELQCIDGRWFLYFAAGAAEREWDIRLYVLECAAANPLDGPWLERGQLRTPWESFALDATTFTVHGVRYLVWAQHDPALAANTCLFISRMKSPTELTGPAVRLSRPEFDWERVRFAVNEGPAVLVRHGRIWVSYSAAGTGAEYCLGLLSAAEDADLLDPRSWRKSPTPVFTSSTAHGVFGPGHNCFTTTPEGRTDLIVYHARDYAEITCDPLDDPNRHTRVQPLGWNADGSPAFGIPAAAH
ncbi:MAG TPA: glycoside hydrolase family 43 protein [Opitutaceae bacterium]|nr:glycoside hydrolase family 43 protein [Opitutaceae bacterium]HND60770.1 glycoside hydrolase family 43 protein [Opitutaceae bacterium]